MSINGVEVEVSIKSINSRHFDLKTVLPSEYDPLEKDIKKILSAVFARGSITLTVSRRASAASKNTKVRINSDLASQWLHAYSELGSALKLHAEPNLDFVARLQNVMVVEDVSKMEGAESKKVLELVRKTAEICDSERDIEGTGLSKTMLKDLAALKDNTHQLNKLLPAHQKAQKAALQKKIAGLAGKGLVDPRKLAAEVASLVDKHDIREELDRIQSHLTACQRFIKSRGPHGKKLEFYSQELLREWNTVGSKIQSAKMTEIVIESKTKIEQIREQIQNIE